jgi:hypothetical protein
MIESRRMRWAGHVAHMGEKRNAYRILVGILSSHLAVGERIMFEWILEIGWGGMDWIDLAQGPVEGACKHGNEPSGSIKCLEILQWLSDWRLLMKDSAPWS